MPPQDRPRLLFVHAHPDDETLTTGATIAHYAAVVVTYDPEGGCGQPDHIYTHRVTTAAVAASDGAAYPGEPWAVPKLYWAVVAKSALAQALNALEDVPPEWIRVTADDVPFRYPDDEIGANRTSRCVPVAGASSPGDRGALRRPWTFGLWSAHRPQAPEVSWRATPKHALAEPSTR